MNKILVGALGVISLVFVSCQTAESELASIPIRNEATDPVGTEISTVTETPLTPTVRVEITPTAEQTVVDQIGKDATQQPTPQPWEKPDWGWVRATWAATGKHGFITGTIAPCQKLAKVVSQCFFTDSQGRTIEFGYDGQKTYYLYYQIGNVKTDQKEKDIDDIIWFKINGDLLFPLDYCTVAKNVTVLFLDSNAPGGFRTWC